MKSSPGTLLVLAFVGAAAWLGAAIPAADVAAEQQSSFVVEPGQKPLACPNPLAVPVGQVGDDGTNLSAGSNDLRREVLVPTGSGAILWDVGDDDGVGSDSLVASLTERVGSGDIAGLASMSCTSPRQSQWLLGGSTTIGNSSRLVLTNPTASATEVLVTVYGTAGFVETLDPIAVGAGGQRSLLLEGYAPEVQSMVLLVEATASGISATVQDSRLNGFLADGTDWLTPVFAPSMEWIMPSVGPSSPDTEQGAAIVRLWSPEAAIVRLTLMTNEGELAWPGGRRLELPANMVVDIPVPESTLASAVISSNVPIFASSMRSVARVPDEGLEGTFARDLAWVNAIAPTEQRDLSLVIPSYTKTLALYALSDTDVQVVAADSGDVLLQFAMTEGKTFESPVTLPQGIQIRILGDVAWYLRISDEPGFIAALAPLDISPQQSDVTVTRGWYVP